MKNAMVSFKIGWLIDGAGGPILEDVFMETKNGLIIAFEKEAPDAPHHPDAVDLSCCTVLPGFVDSHIHLFMSGSPDPEVRRCQLNAPFEDMKEVIKGHLLSQLERGVMALRDGGDYGNHARRYKEECLPEDKFPIYLKIAGRAWHAPGRYGGLIGRPPLEGRSLAHSVAKGSGSVDHIKIVNSGLNSLLEFGKQTPPQFDPEDLKEAVRAGRELALKTMVHANGELPVKLAIEAGCHSIEHGFFMGEDNLKRMAEKGVYWVPTAFTMESYSRMLGPGIPAALIAKRNLYHQLEQMRKAQEYGVMMAAGTDSGSLGVFHGRGMRGEIKMFMLAGLSLEKAIQCASGNGADLLNVQDELGRLMPGMPATFLALRGAPKCVLEAMDRPEQIYVRAKSLWDSLPGLPVDPLSQ
jgi:imidazolonepropionase-like amidohydrolase